MTEREILEASPEKVHVNTNAYVKSILLRAAHLDPNSRSLTDFVVKAALERAERVMGKAEISKDGETK